MNTQRILSILLVTLFFTGCTSVQVDQLRWEETNIDPESESIVVLGRHHSPEYETESSLVECIGRQLKSSIRGLDVVDEREFQDTMYPWFEPRTAPLTMDKFIQILDQPMVSEALENRNIRYMVWIEGATEKINGIGSMSCAIVAGGGGCFGFGAWEDESRYEASIWDFSETREVGRISTDASGTSYMPAIIVPIPLLARVQANACEGMGKQLGEFLQSEEAS